MSFWTWARAQRGFTLIELLAVMAIIAVLAAIIAPAVSGTKDTSAQSQASQDALQVRSGANQYFSDQETVEGVESKDVSSLSVKLATAASDGDDFTGDNAVSTSISATQKISSRWPELFITSSATSSDSAYYAEFPVSGTTVIDTVYLLDFDDVVIGGQALLEKYTAVDFDALLDGNYLEAKPKGVDATRDLVIGDTTQSVHTLLWLFRKTNTPGSTDQTGRDVRVFKLAEAEKVGNDVPTNPAMEFALTYERIF